MSLKANSKLNDDRANHRHDGDDDEDSVACEGNIRF